MNGKLKEKSVLVYDYGLFTELAATLVKYFKNVYYFCPWQDDFPSSIKQMIGQEFKGIKRVQNFWDYVNMVDLICCFDTYSGDLVDYLRSKGYRVWGTGSAEDMELKRWEMRKKQFEIGLPTQTTILIKSIDDLELYFKGIANMVKEQLGYEDEDTITKMLNSIFKKYDNFSEDYYIAGDKEILMEELINGAQNKFVKCNMRGDIETFFAPNYNDSLSKFNSLSEKFGHRQKSKEIEFIIENSVDGLEPGFDGIQIDGEFISPTCWGIEKRGEGYVGQVVDYLNLPMSAKIINAKLKDVFKLFMPTRSFFSTEFVISKENGKPYLIDLTVRNPAPVPSAIYSELYQNFGDIVYYGAEGKMVIPIIEKTKYIGGVSVESEWAQHHELEIEVPKSIQRWVKFRKAYQKDNKFYAVSGFTSICSIIAFGNSIDEVISLTKERLKKIKAYSLLGGVEGMVEAGKDLEKIKRL